MITVYALTFTADFFLLCESEMRLCMNEMGPEGFNRMEKFVICQKLSKIRKYLTQELEATYSSQAKSLSSDGSCEFKMLK